MQIVIDINEEEYNNIKRTNSHYLIRYERMIKNGVPLPKGHGRLIDADKCIRHAWNDFYKHEDEWEKKDNKCKWIYYDYRTVCPKEHDIDNPYWRIPENRMEALRYCPYCGKEIEIEADKVER